MQSPVIVIVERRLPTFDAALRVSRSIDVVRMQLESFFAAGRERPKGFVLFDGRFNGEFDGVNSFVVRSYPNAIHSSLRPVIDGYVVANEDGGCDLHIRVTYPRLWWVFPASLLAMMLVGTLFSRGITGDLLFLFPAAAIIAVVTLLPVWLEGSSFLNRVTRIMRGGA